MSVRVREFIGLLQNNVELINEIAKLESHTISRKNVLNLITQLYSPNTLEILENRIKRLSTSKPFPVLQYLDDTDEYLLAPKVANLVLWLSNNLHLASHRIIKALISDIEDASQSIVKLMDEQPINLYLLRKRMDQLSTSNIELSECAGGNLRSIGTKVQEFKEEVLDFETKQIKARLLMDDHLTPMREIIDPDGPMINALESAARLLGDISARQTIPQIHREFSSNLQSKIINNQKSVRENHWSAYSQLQPILAPYLKPASDLVKGCSVALSLINKRGVKSINLHEHFPVIKASRPRGIYDDEHFELWYQRNESREAHDDTISFVPGGSIPLNLDIPIISLAKKITQNGPTEDLLEFILSLDDYQMHTLTTCNNAATDILIEINKFDRIWVGELREYTRNEETLEVRKIAVE